jgi:hypothetical protein
LENSVLAMLYTGWNLQNAFVRGVVVGT